MSRLASSTQDEDARHGVSLHQDPNPLQRRLLPSNLVNLGTADPVTRTRSVVTDMRQPTGPCCKQEAGGSADDTKVLTAFGPRDGREVGQGPLLSCTWGRAPAGQDTQARLLVGAGFVECARSRVVSTHVHDAESVCITVACSPNDARGD